MFIKSCLLKYTKIVFFNKIASNRGKILKNTKMSFSTFMAFFKKMHVALIKNKSAKI